MAESDDWLLIADAPLDTLGLLWTPELPDRVDAAGQVYAYPDGGRGVSSSWKGYKFTHWHPFPKPPLLTPTPIG